MSFAQSFYSRRNSPEYLNWLAVGDGLTILAGGLRKYVKSKMKEFHSVLMKRLGGIMCTCPCTLGVKPNPHCIKPMSCLWARELINYHQLTNAKSISWHQSDSSKWHDPVDGYWEVSKVYMLDLGKNWTDVKNIDCIDLTGILNLMSFCRHINVQQHLLTAVREWRNKWAHASTLQFSESNKQAAFRDIMNLIDDSELLSSCEIQNCRTSIEYVQLAEVSMILNDELHILEELWHFRQSEVLVQNITNEIREQCEELIQKESQALKELIETLRNEREKVENNYSSIQPICEMLVLIFLTVTTSCGGLKKGARCLLWLALLLGFLFCHVGDNNDIALDKGCPRCTWISPISHFGFQKFNFSNHLTYTREKFHGRKWLFNDLEFIFESDRALPGVLIIGEPGSGKSALISQLICSPYSSLFIHNNIVGYHLCDYSEKGKRHGGWFVRNLVDQVAGSISEYADHVANNKQLRRELDEVCEEDPILCFHSTIIGPLRDLKTQPDDLQYIVIDALDECLENDVKTSAILDIINSKISYFPKWLKVILTSRNLTAVTTRIPRTLKRVHLNPSDDRNMEDIRRYVHQFLSRNSFFTDRLRDAVRGRSTAEKFRSLVNKLTDNGEGNFLVVKKTLEYIADSNGKVNLESFPASLHDMYKAFFKRYFDEFDFQRFKPLFEVLLAAGTPLRIDNIEYIFELQNFTVKVSKLIQQVSLLLRYGQDGTVKIYHLSFAQWLASQTSDPDGFPIDTNIGHQYVADYLLHSLRQENRSLTFGELVELSMHVLFGGICSKHLDELSNFDVSGIWNLHSGKYILHNLAVKPGSFPLLRIFLPKFATADIPDNEGKTPAFYAASEGMVENLRVLIEGGANINYYTGKNDSSLDPVSILVQNSGLEDVGLMYTAIINGHVEIVKLLLENNVSLEQRQRNLPTPLQLAAAKGDINMVQILYYGGFLPDVISLHHAAARNHSAVVSFLVEAAGVEDKCVTSCKPPKVYIFKQNVTVEEFHSSLCESALHAAVSRGHTDIVRYLLTYSPHSLECKHHSGKTPLMDAVERNDFEMVELLLNAGANVEAACGDELSSECKDLMCNVSKKYKQGFLYTAYCEKDFCPCGYKAIHLCARYGLWEMAVQLSRKWNARLIDNNCDGESVSIIGINFDQPEFIEQLDERSLLDVDRTAAVVMALKCGSAEILKLFVKDLNNVLAIRSKQPSLVVSSVFFPVVLWSPYPASTVFKSCSQVLNSDHHGTMETKVGNESRKRISSLKLILQSQNDISLLLNEKDNTGQTALHVAAMVGFSDAVKTLVEFGSKINTNNGDGRTALQVALNGSPMYPPAFSQCFSIFDGDFSACNTTNYDETVSHLIWAQKSEIQKCNSHTAKMLMIVIYKQMPLSLYTLLKVGVDATCREKQSFRPLSLHFFIGGGEKISDIFKMFDVPVSVECGVPFVESDLHLMAHSSGISNSNNEIFFKLPKNIELFFFKKLIKNHHDGHRIFDKCRDEEGYLVIHRAVQGGNIDMVRWFMDIGVDLFKKTTSGLTALDLSVLHLELPLEIPVSLDQGASLRLSAIGHKDRHLIFEMLLEKYLLPAEKEHSRFQCNSNYKGLSPLHVSTVRGGKMSELFYKRARKILPNFHLNCENEHRILPRYLSYFYDSVEHARKQMSTPLSDFISLKSVALNRFPDREAELYMIFDYFYETPDAMLILMYEQILNAYPIEVSKCPEFYELLPNKKRLNKLVTCYDHFRTHDEDHFQDEEGNKGHWKKNHDYGREKSGHENENGEYEQENGEDEICEMVKNEIQVRHHEESRCARGDNVVALFKGSKRGRKYYIDPKLSSFHKYMHACYCALIMQHLQEWFTSRPRRNRHVSWFIAERMDWSDVSPDGDVRDRWPFYFLYKKVMDGYKDYKYLDVLNEALEINDQYYYDSGSGKELL